MRLEGRVALITGGGRGIGKAIGLAYAKEGARPAMAARTIDELRASAQEVEALGAETLIIPTDVTDQGQVDEMVRSTLERYSRIDILVNNAGIAGPVGPVQDNDASHWIHTIQVNLIGVYLCCRAVLPSMISRNRGKIINMSGVGGPGATAYAASKAALIDLTEKLSGELTDTNIQVNAISPGSINTRMWEDLRDGALAVDDTRLVELSQRILSGGGASLERAVELAVFLAGDTSGDLSGRLIRATDDFSNMPAVISEIMESDAYTMRRVEF